MKSLFAKRTYDHKAFGVGERAHLHINPALENTQYLQLISGTDSS